MPRPHDVLTSIAAVAILLSLSSEKAGAEDIPISANTLGVVDIGMTFEEVEAVLGARFAPLDEQVFSPTCRGDALPSATTAEMPRAYFVFSDRRLVRIDVRNDRRVVTPQGLRIGDRHTAIEGRMPPEAVRSAANYTGNAEDPANHSFSYDLTDPRTGRGLAIETDEDGVIGFQIGEAKWYRVMEPCQ